METTLTPLMETTSMGDIDYAGLLGKMPSYASLALGIYSNIENAAFKAKLFAELDSIENTINEINQQLKQLQWDIQMDEVYQNTDNCIANIYLWYTGNVTEWLHGNTTSLNLDNGYLSTSPGSGYGAQIEANCISYLETINTVITKGLPLNDGSGQVVDIFTMTIQRMLGTDPADLVSYQNCSLLESSYQYFSKLVGTQLHGLLCLQAINSPYLKQYCYVVYSNIIQQGLHCQSVINDTLNGDQAESFTWFGNSGQWSNPSKPYHYYQDNWTYASVSAINNTDPESKVVTSIQFIEPLNSEYNNSNRWGLQVATAIPKSNGATFESTFQQMGNGENYLIVDSDPDSVPANMVIDVSFSQQDIILPVGQVVTDIQLTMPDFGFLVPNNAHAGCFQAAILSDTLLPNGQLAKNPNLVVQEPAINDPQPYLSVQEFSILNIPLCTSPITGFGFCTNGNRVGVKLQTSIHQNAFAPSLIQCIETTVSLTSAATKCYVSNQDASLVRFPELGGQNFMVQYSTPGGTTSNFGAIPLCLLNPSNFNMALGVYNGEVKMMEKGTPGFLCNWQPFNPADFNNQVETGIYNWSSMALMIIGDGDAQFLTYDSTTGQLALATPLTETGGTGGTGGGTPVTFISDLSFVWELAPRFGSGYYAFQVNGYHNSMYLRMDPTTGDCNAQFGLVEAGAKLVDPESTMQSFQVTNDSGTITLNSSVDPAQTATMQYVYTDNGVVIQQGDQYLQLTGIPTALQSAPQPGGYGQTNLVSDITSATVFQVVELG